MIQQSGPASLAQFRETDQNPVFWPESLAVVAFGICWLTKGEAILKDHET